MQYHLDGFTSGDPAWLPPAAEVNEAAPLEEVDVLIVGCGPAGLTLAMQLSMFPAITTRIVDQKVGPLTIGQADGVACRSMEMFEAFGFKRAGHEGVLLGQRDLLLEAGSDSDIENHSSGPYPRRGRRALGVSAHHLEPGE